MATITLSLSAKTDKATSKHEVLIRFFHGRINQRAKTNIFVHPERWDDKRQIIDIPKWRMLTDEIRQLQTDATRLNNLKDYIFTLFQSVDKTNVAKDWLKSVIHEFSFPKKPETDEVNRHQPQFFDVFSKYIDESEFSEHRKKQFWVLWRTLKRFELYKDLTLTFDNITDETLRMFEKFYKKEPNFCNDKGYSKILDATGTKRTPQARGDNALNNLMRHLRAFIYWAVDRGYTSNNPFKKYKIPDCVYGTPIYITIDERNQLYRYDFSDNSRLACQRDIFVFQCLIGCRVSDLWAMTKSNIVNGAIEYIPRKTKKEDASKVRVPLNAIATEIVERYKDYQGATLFPFTSQQHYNIAIKEMFKIVGLTRMVTVINPTTGEEEHRPICDVASSHMARRCFVGNLYKKVKDPNLIGKLSGHKEGSRAFSRYREIDEETSKELVTMLE